MAIQDRIRERRKELNMSQEDLAKRLGYTDRSTISKIESGTNDLSQRKIAAFAKALNTTTLWLMGDADSPSPSTATPEKGSPSTLEIQLLTIFQQLSVKGKQKVIAYANDISGEYIKTLEGTPPNTKTSQFPPAANI